MAIFFQRARNRRTLLKTITLTQGKVALIDDEDYERISKHNWCYNRAINTAERAGHAKSTILMHREVMNAPANSEVDHRDGDELNNRRSTNLRLCTHLQNSHNRRKAKMASSKYKGVTFTTHCRGRSWQASIKLQDIFSGSYNKFLGYFAVEEDAARAYDKAARYHYKEFAALNFPGEGERSCLV